MEGSGLIEGYKNLLFNKDLEYSQKRLDICKNCELYSNGICNPMKKIKDVVTGEMVKGCGCYLKAKVRVPYAYCPAHKWTEYGNFHDG